MDDIVKQAVAILNEGGIIIYPTDTAFGIGCRVDRRDAVDRLFEIRKRPLTQATPVLVDGEHMALSYFDSPPDIVRHFMKTYWPGALTIISACREDLLPSPIRGGTKTVGLRMPDHPTALQIIHEVGVPILGPSANFHGEATPYGQSDLNPDLTKLVDLVVPGECKRKQASTVVDCTTQPFRIIRQGAVTVTYP